MSCRNTSRGILTTAAAFIAAALVVPCAYGQFNFNSATQATQRLQQEMQQRAQLEAQQRALQEAQQRAQQEAQQRAQQEAQERAQQEAQQRAQQEAQERAQQEAQQRALQEAQQRAQQEAQQRAQQEAQERAQQQAQQRTQRQRAQQQAREAPQRTQVENARTPPSEARPAPTRPAPSAPMAAAPKALTPRAQAAGAGGTQGSAAAATRTVKLDASTKVTVRRDHSLVTTARATDGSQIVTTGRYSHGKPVIDKAYAYKHEANGDRSKVFLDGHKIIYSKNGDLSRISPTGVTVTTQRGGLRQASLANGRPIFQEHRERVTEGSSSREVIVRTEYASIVGGYPEFHPLPVLFRYDVATFYGVPVLTYEPAVFSPLFLGPFLVGFAQPVVVTSACLICPAPVVAWEQPVQAYADPVDLVADLQITSAVQDGMADAASVDALPIAVSDPEIADLKTQVAALQDQVDAAARDNAELRDTVASLKSEDSAGYQAAFTVSDDVRQQIRSQVRENFKLHQERRELNWPELVSSGAARRYILQVSDTLDATDADGTECALTAGDLLRLAEGTPAGQEVLRMRVVTSKGGSCAAGSVVAVSIHDAQAMLNDFTKRQEANMKKLQPAIASSKPA